MNFKVFKKVVVDYELRGEPIEGNERQWHREKGSSNVWLTEGILHPPMAEAIIKWFSESSCEELLGLETHIINMLYCKPEEIHHTLSLKGVPLFDLIDKTAENQLEELSETIHFKDEETEEFGSDEFENEQLESEQQLVSGPFEDSQLEAVDLSEPIVLFGQTIGGTGDRDLSSGNSRASFESSCSPKSGGNNGKREFKYSGGVSGGPRNFDVNSRNSGPIYGDSTEANRKLAQLKHVPDQVLGAILEHETEHQRVAKIVKAGSHHIESVDGEEHRIILVKCCHGGWESANVRISRDEYEYALSQGQSFWLYVVEHITSSSRMTVNEVNDIGSLIEEQFEDLVSQFKIDVAFRAHTNVTEDLTLEPEIGGRIKVEVDGESDWFEILQVEEFDDDPGILWVTYQDNQQGEVKIEFDDQDLVMPEFAENEFD